jgi:alpha-L-fucosidase
VDVARLNEFGREIRRRFGESLAETSGTGGRLKLDLHRTEVVDYVVIQEDIMGGERISEFVVQGRSGSWRDLAAGRVVGHKRIFELAGEELDAVRLVVREARGVPRVRRLAVFNSEPG